MGSDVSVLRGGGLLSERMCVCSSLQSVMPGQSLLAESLHWVPGEQEQPGQSLLAESAG